MLTGCTHNKAADPVQTVSPLTAEERSGFLRRTMAKGRTLRGFFLLYLVQVSDKVQ